MPEGALKELREELARLKEVLGRRSMEPTTLAGSDSSETDPASELSGEEAAGAHEEAEGEEESSRAFAHLRELLGEETAEVLREAMLATLREWEQERKEGHWKRMREEELEMMKVELDLKDWQVPEISQAMEEYHLRMRQVFPLFGRGQEGFEEALKRMNRLQWETVDALSNVLSSAQSTRLAELLALLKPHKPPPPPPKENREGKPPEQPGGSDQR